MLRFTEQLTAARQTLSQAILALAVAILAALVGAGALGFLTAAAYLALLAVLAPPAAAAATGAILLAVMAVLLLIARAFIRPSRKEVEEAAPPPPSSEFEAISRLAEQIGPQARRHVPLAAGLTFVAGFILGLKPNARRALWRAIMKKL